MQERKYKKKIVDTNQINLPLQFLIGDERAIKLKDN